MKGGATGTRGRVMPRKVLVNRKGVAAVAAGLFDFCVITGLIDNIWSGREVRARGRRGAPRTV